MYPKVNLIEKTCFLLYSQKSVIFAFKDWHRAQARNIEMLIFTTSTYRKRSEIKSLVIVFAPKFMYLMAVLFGYQNGCSRQRFFAAPWIEIIAQKCKYIEVHSRY